MFAYLRNHHKRSGSQPSSPDVTAPPSNSPSVHLHPSSNSPSVHLQPSSNSPSVHLQPPSSSHGADNDRLTSPNPSQDESPNFFYFSKTPDPPAARPGQGQSAGQASTSTQPPIPPLIPRVNSAYNDVERNSQSRDGDYRGESSVFSLAGQSKAEGQEHQAKRSHPSKDVRQQQQANARNFEQNTAAISQDEWPRPRQPSPARNLGMPDPNSTVFHSRASPATTGYKPRTPLDAPSANQLSPAGSLISAPSFGRDGKMPLSPSRFPVESHRAPPVPPKSISQTYNPVSTTRPTYSSIPSQMQKPERTGKKLGLRNPVSLLLRRRSGHAVENLNDESLVSSRVGMSYPVGYDPSIRGNVVHDFSAPRPRRNFSSNTSTLFVPGQEQSHNFSSSDGRDPSPERRLEKQHTPVFKEHFDDDDGVSSQNNAGIRAEQLANQDFLKRNSLPLDKALPLPPFARTPPEPVEVEENSSVAQIPSQDPSIAPVVGPTTLAVNDVPLSPVVEDDAVSPTTVKPSTKKASQRSSQPTGRSRATSRTSIGDFQPAGLPSHLASNASRFSFQLANKDSAAQERLLEERHKQKMAAKAAASAHEQPEYDNEGEDEDGFGYDDDDMDLDGYEEDIPTVGEEWDYGGGMLGVSGLSMGLSGMTLQDQAKLALASHPAGDFTMLPNSPLSQGLGIDPGTTEEMNAEEESVIDVVRQPSDTAPEPQPQPQPRKVLGNVLNDDFYFDDGEFGAIEAEGEGEDAFDEAVFDDPTHPLYERKQPVRGFVLEQTSDTEEPEDDPQHRTLAPHNSHRKRLSRPSGSKKGAGAHHPGPSSSSGTITAYHEALVSAANKAAADGRFKRSESVDFGTSEADTMGSPTSPRHDDDEDSPVDVSSRPSLIPDDGRFSQATTNFSPPQPLDEPLGHAQTFMSPSKGVVFSLPSGFDEPFTSDFDMSDYDSTFEDDPMIAAANAEALAYDEDGLYGQEFGFYARPNPSGNSAQDSGDEVAISYGGYFGPKDWSEIKRKKSIREPNLTPITERSEFSTRNSFIGSLPFSERPGTAGGIAGQQASPGIGLAALARSMTSPGWDASTEMNIEALMKLRSRAFAGSQSSLVSLGGGPTSSPLGSSPVLAKDTRALWSSPMSRGASAMSLFEEREEEASDDDAILEEVNIIGEDDYEDAESLYSQQGFEDDEMDGAIASSGSPTLQAIPTSPSPPPRTVSPLAPNNTQVTSQDHTLQSGDKALRPPLVSRPSAGVLPSPSPSPPEDATAEHSSSYFTASGQAKPGSLHSSTGTTRSDITISTVQPPMSPVSQPTSHPATPQLASTTPRAPRIATSSSTAYSPSSSPTASTKVPFHFQFPQPSASSLKDQPVLSTPRPRPAATSQHSHSHSRTPSDSIAYVQERDEVSGETVWVFERRGVGKRGVVEVLERRVVEGGYI